MRNKYNKIVISECLCQRSSDLKLCKITGLPTETLLRTSVISLTVILRMLKNFPEDDLGNDDIIYVYGQQ